MAADRGRDPGSGHRGTSQGCTAEKREGGGRAHPAAHPHRTAGADRRRVLVWGPRSRSPDCQRRRLRPAAAHRRPSHLAARHRGAGHSSPQRQVDRGRGQRSRPLYPRPGHRPVDGSGGGAADEAEGPGPGEDRDHQRADDAAEGSQAGAEEAAEGPEPTARGDAALPTTIHAQTESKRVAGRRHEFSLSPRRVLQPPPNQGRWGEHMRRWLLATLLVMAGALPVGAQTTDQYPNRPVRFVVPFPPGGSYDVIARLLGRYISERWGQQIIVDNRSGAAGNIGSEYVARSKPDGYTLLVFGDGLLINQSLYSNPPYDSERDFDPITLAAISPQMLVANPGLGVKTIADLVALAKTRPGQINYGTAGAGTPGHLGGELLNRLAGIQLVHVPHRGGAQTKQDRGAGQIELAFTGMPATPRQLRGCALRP